MSQVRFWHEADVTWAWRDVRFQGESGHGADWLNAHRLLVAPLFGRIRPEHRVGEDERERVGVVARGEPAAAPVVLAFEQGGLGDPVSSWPCRSQNVEWPQGAEVLMVGPILVSIVGAVVAAIVAGAAQAQPAAQARDAAAIKACLERQKATLGHACIGIVADPCMAAAGGDTAKRKACADRERVVWQAELEAALRGVRKGGFKEITESVTQAQKSWETSLRILCPIFGRIEPGTLPGDATTCTMVETASRALLLRRLAEAVNEH